MTINNINNINGLFSIKQQSSKLINDIIKDKPSNMAYVMMRLPHEMNLGEFQCEYVNQFLDKLNERKDELYKYLDSVKLSNGSTIEKELSTMFDMDNIKTESRSLLHKTSGENVEPIIKNGFDPKKISTTEYGPGFYFSDSESALTIYSGKKLSVNYEGRSTNGVHSDKYNSIRSNITLTLSDYLKIPLDFTYIMAMQDFEALNKFANEYSRQVIVNKLGIDGANTNKYGYFVVYNPESIKDIKSIM